VHESIIQPGSFADHITQLRDDEESPFGDSLTTTASKRRRTSESNDDNGTSNDASKSNLSFANGEEGNVGRGKQEDDTSKKRTKANPFKAAQLERERKQREKEEERRKRTEEREARDQAKHHYYEARKEKKKQLSKKTTRGQPVLSNQIDLILNKLRSK
jgi:hypothetical protein